VQERDITETLFHTKKLKDRVNTY